MPQIAIPALSPRGTEEQGMTGDANGHQETWPNLEISRNSQISDYLKIPPLSDWGSRGPGFKSRQPDQKSRSEAMPLGLLALRLTVPANSTRATKSDSQGRTSDFRSCFLRDELAAPPTE